MSYFSFSNAIQFKASHFANVADSWGISFSIWNSGENSKNVDFEYEIVDINGNNEVSKIANKTLYNIDNGETASIWLRSDSKDLKTYDVPNMTSAIKVRDGVGSRNGKCCQNAIGYFNNGGNNIDKNTQQVALFTSAYSGAIGASIIPENFYKVVSLFAARKLIEKNWINSKDEYLAPNTNHEKWNEFVNDSIVYSLFHSSSNQSSLRNVDYKGKKWDIKNEFFWLSNKEIESLANTNGFTQTYNDARTSKERYVYNKLQTITLSPEAQDVLDKASDIVRNTFKYRELFNQEHPEYQIMNWDCGWYQIKAVAKQYAKSDYDEFVKLFKALENKMRPMVYTLGFLKK